MGGIDSDLIRGHIDTIILKTLYGSDKYGLEIMQEVEEKTKGSYELKQPTLYSALKRLESQGLISSYWVDSEVGGRRHYYKLTDKGLVTYRDNQMDWLRSRKIIDSLIYNTEIEYDTIYADGERRVRVIKGEDTEDVIVDGGNNSGSANGAAQDALDADIINETDEVADADDDQQQDSTPLEDAEDDEQEELEAENEGLQDTEDEEENEESVDAQTETNERSEQLSIGDIISDANDVSDNFASTDYQVMEAPQEDEDDFVSYEDQNSAYNDSFFAANKEVVAESEPKQAVTAPIMLATPTLDEGDEVLNEPTSLDIEEPAQNVDDEVEASETTWMAENEPYNPEENLAASEDELYVQDDTTTSEVSEEKTEDDDDIYTLDDKEDIAYDDDELYTYTPEEEPEDKPAEEDNSPTYINFGGQNYSDEADITKQNASEQQQEDEYPADLYVNNDIYQEPKVEPEQQEPRYSSYDYTQEYTSQPEPIAHASAEEINELYRTTENYENLQAKYTDETYKQMLDELETYSSTSSTKVDNDLTNVVGLRELERQFNAEGITIRRYTKPVKESNDSKTYIKTNQIKMVKSWIVYGITCFALLLTYLLMLPFKANYTFNFAFWPFVVAAAVMLVIPAYYTIRYACNMYAKVVAKYAPRLNIFLSLLITIQLMLITYCINLQCGFYSFSQENYNHLLWVIPLVLSFIPIVDALVYYPLFNSKKYHV